MGFTFGQKRNTMTTQRQRQYIKSQLWLLNRSCQTMQGWETQTGNTANATKHEFFEERIFSTEEFSSKSISTHTRKDYHSTNQGVFEARLQAGGGSVQRSSCHDPLKSERLEPRRGGRRGEVVRHHHLLIKVDLWCDDETLLIILILTKTLLAECWCIWLFSA